MIRFLEIKTFLGLTKVLKKGPIAKQNPDKRKVKRKHKNYLPLASLPLLSCCLLMLVLMSSLFASFAPKSGCFHMSHCVKKI
jgi:hypothetical protein